MNMILFYIAALLSFFRAPVDTSLPYDMSSPGQVYVLPDTLHEVSGIVSAGNSIACVQDENGIIFFYDPQSQTITRHVPFGPNGDYEDIAYTGDAYYVLRSDGLVFCVKDSAGRTTVREFFTGVPSKNNEGLCYDRSRNALLIAAKTKSGKGMHAKNRREVYAFDLKTKTIQRDPVLVLDINRLKIAAGDAGIRLPVKYKKKRKEPEKVLKMTTSAIAIHPSSGDVYLISSEDHLLFVYSPDMQFKKIVQLDPLRFNKAEGLTFTATGELLVSNEGGNSHPTVLEFRKTGK